METLVSIIMPTYNRGYIIRKAIDSVLKQSYPIWELIIVDDASSDDTAQIVKEYADSRIKYYKNSTNIGANGSRNKGILLAKGEYICFLDSDCCYKYNKLEVQINSITLGYDMLFSEFEYYKEQTCRIVPIKVEERGYYDKCLKKILLYKNVIDTSTIMVRKKVLVEIGLFDENMPRMQDYELAVRIAKNKKIKFIDQILVENYYSSNSITSNHEAYFEAIIKMLKKHRDFWNDSDDILRFMYLGVDYCFNMQLGTLYINKYLDMLQKEMINEFSQEVFKLYRLVLEVYQLRSLIFEQNKEKYLLNVHEKLKSTFMIYGTGIKARDTYNGLTEDEKKNMLCFIVSEKRAGEDILYGLPICSLEDVRAMLEKEQIFVLLALNSWNGLQVKSKLDSIGYKNYALFNV